MSADIIISKSYPGVEFEATETAAVYHEDRECTDTLGGSQMFRTYNAQLDDSVNPPLWSLVNAADAAFATVQGPDGSLHFLSMPANSPPWPTDAWEGSGNNTVFNAVDYGMSTTASGSENAAALLAAVAAAAQVSGASGGIVFIPAGAYAFTGPVSLSGISGGLVIAGSSVGTSLVQQEESDMFDCSSGSGQNGIRFRDLQLQYLKESEQVSGIAINCASGGAYTTAERCVFVNCPQAFSCGTDGLAVHCGLINCVVEQDWDKNENTTQIVLSGSECFAINCLLAQTPMINSGPTGCTGIEVAAGNANRIVRCQLSDFDIGISIVDGASNTWIVDCDIETLQPLIIQTTETDGSIFGVYAKACSVQMLHNPPTGAAPSSGIYIAGNVEGVILSGCFAFGFPNAGLQIATGSEIQVNGGKYSANGAAPGPLGAGIALTGACDKVTIFGADCAGLYAFWSGAVQPYGISVSGGATNVWAVGCDLRDNTAALYVPANGTDFRVTNSLGYNDQQTVIDQTPESGQPFSGSTFGYYGPIEFYVPLDQPVNSITIDSVFTGLTSGSFSVSPGEESAAIDYAGSSISLLIVGR